MRLWALGAALSAVTLVGCDVGPTLSGAARDPLPRLSLADGDVVVAGPEGYCIDPTATEAQRDFAVVASCLILSEGEDGISVPPAVVTVTVGPPGTTAVLPEAAGLAAAAEVALLSGDARDGLITAHLASGGDAVMEGGDARYWRGAFLQNGHLVGLALYAPEGSSFAGEGGAGMLQRMRARIASASAAGA